MAICHCPRRASRDAMSRRGEACPPCHGPSHVRRACRLAPRSGREPRPAGARRPACRRALRHERCFARTQAGSARSSQAILVWPTHAQSVGARHAVPSITFAVPANPQGRVSNPLPRVPGPQSCLPRSAHPDSVEATHASPVRASAVPTRPPAPAETGRAVHTRNTPPARAQASYLQAPRAPRWPRW